jgi:two-component sensor histidine kinase
MDIGIPAPSTVDPQIDFRQLRHQTKNALARILARVHVDLAAHPSARRVAGEVERHILLTAQISDALFGLTRAPGRFEERLFALCDAVVELASEPEQCLKFACTVSGEPDWRLHDTILRVAHELVANAVRHGMHMRLTGRISVSVVADAAGARLEVIDDGWGCGKAPHAGEGLRLANLLAQERGGAVTLARAADRTVAVLCLPSR